MPLKKLSKNNCIAIITARGGSKRIKNKNILNFFGKPMIAYSIEAAKKTKLFDQIYVSTDSLKIKKISEKFGAIVPFLREKKLSDDFTGTQKVIRSFINKITCINKNFIYVCCIYPTAPLIKHESIISGYKEIVKNIYDYVISANNIEKFPNKYFQVKNKKIKKIYNRNKFNLRSQDMPVYFQDAGQFYWAKKEKWLKRKIFTSKTAVIKISNNYVQDLDNYNDLELLKFKKLNNE